MTYLEFLATIIIGYILGRLTNTTTSDVVTQLQGVKHTLNRQLPHKVGAIQTPTQHEIIRKENPELAGEEEAMRETFQKAGIPDDGTQI